MGATATEFFANVTGPNGERPRIEPSLIGRIMAAFKKTPPEEIETLRRMIKEAIE